MTDVRTQPATPRQWLALSLLPRIGPRRLLAMRCAGLDWPEGWLSKLPDAPRRVMAHYLHNPMASALHVPIERAMAWLDQGPDRHLLTPDHPCWPRLLDELPDPPPLLWAWGDTEALRPAALAVVGTRRPTREGQDNAHRFARDMVTAGYGVVSGLALGVDGCAHRGALEARGRTIAVLGCGVDVLYPRSHARLRQQILEAGGLLLSEHLPGTEARPRFFPRRNRIVTGLSLGVLVVEAAMASGSLVSARLAMEQNREVFALPGSLHNPQARGCLWLIREGAHLVTSLEDLLQELPERQWSTLAADLSTGDSRTHDGDSPGLQDSGQGAVETPVNTGPDDPLWALLETTPISIDALVERSGEAISALQTRLLMLELDGWAVQVAGGWVRRLA